MRINILCIKNDLHMKFPYRETIAAKYFDVVLVRCLHDERDETASKNKIVKLQRWKEELQWGKKTDNENYIDGDSGPIIYWSELVTRCIADRNDFIHKSNAKHIDNCIQSYSVSMSILTLSLSLSHADNSDCYMTKLRCIVFLELYLTAKP